MLWHTDARLIVNCSSCQQIEALLQLLTKTAAVHLSFLKFPLTMKALSELVEHMYVRTAQREMISEPKPALIKTINKNILQVKKKKKVCSS